MKEIERYYRALGLEVGASLEEINQAYRDLAFIWHPDRLPKNNQRLLDKAVAKLQEINHAREQLKSHQIVSHPSKTVSVRRENRSAYPYSHYTPTQSQRPYYRDWSGADLKGANLKEKDLSGRKLIAADLSYADLSDSFLHKVNLERANMYRANLFRANLLKANLRFANLQQVNLVGADLSGADLTEADLSGAKVGSGNRIMVKLTGTILKGATLPDGSIYVDS